MTPRLHIDAPLSEGGLAPLSAEQTHYLRNVLRLEDGAAIRAFNARAGEFDARLVSTGRKTVAAHVGLQVRAPAADPDLWLIFAAVKRAALETIVQKAVELGAGRLVPVFTARTQRERVNEARLGAIATEAAEQCERLSVPEIAPALALDNLLNAWPEDRRLYFCDEAGDDPDALWGGREGRARPLSEAVQSAPAEKAALLIGPEGGFAPEERVRLRAQPFVVPATLGPRILRADTAAVVALALWQSARGDLRGDLKRT